MRKPGKLRVAKVCAQLTNSLTKLDFYVDVDVGHHVGHLVYLHIGHHVQLHVGHIFLFRQSLNAP